METTTNPPSLNQEEVDLLLNFQRSMQVSTTTELPPISSILETSPPSPIPTNVAVMQQQQQPQAMRVEPLASQPQSFVITNAYEPLDITRPKPIFVPQVSPVITPAKSTLYHVREGIVMNILAEKQRIPGFSYIQILSRMYVDLDQLVHEVSIMDDALLDDEFGIGDFLRIYSRDDMVLYTFQQLYRYKYTRLSHRAHGYKSALTIDAPFKHEISVIENEQASMVTDIAQSQVRKAVLLRGLCRVIDQTFQILYHQTWLWIVQNNYTSPDDFIWLSAFLEYRTSQSARVALDIRSGSINSNPINVLNYCIQMEFAIKAMENFRSMITNVRPDEVENTTFGECMLLQLHFLLRMTSLQEIQTIIREAIEVYRNIWSKLFGRNLDVIAAGLATYGTTEIRRWSRILAIWIMPRIAYNLTMQFFNQFQGNPINLPIPPTSFTIYPRQIVTEASVKSYYEDSVELLFMARLSFIYCESLKLLRQSLGIGPSQATTAKLLVWYSAYTLWDATPTLITREALREMAVMSMASIIRTPPDPFFVTRNDTLPQNSDFHVLRLDISAIMSRRYIQNSTIKTFQTQRLQV